MKKITTLLIIILCTLDLYAQNATIVYAGSGLCNITNNNQCCNTFNMSGNIKPGGLEHWPVAGGVTFDGTNIKMSATKNSQNNIDNGMAYAIKYPFKVGYNYNITIDIAHTSTPVTSWPTITTSYMASLPNPNETHPTDCGAVQGWLSSINQSGIIDIVFPSQAAKKTYNLKSFSVPYAQSYLVITTSMGFWDNSSTAFISKITITESSFTLTPAAVNLTVGNSIEQVFTVNNVNNVPGVTSYEWNLGAMPNGWMYQGNAAPEKVITATNTLSLSSAPCTNILKSITATAKTIDKSFVTNSSVATVKPAIAPTLSIAGQNYICSGTADYTINGTPSGATVEWTSSNPAEAAIVSQNNLQTITVKRVGTSNTTATLTAYVTHCASVYPATYNISLGTPKPGPIEVALVDLAIGRIQAIIEAVPGASYYNWYKNNIIHDTYHGTFAQIPITKNKCNAEYSISVEAVNNCGKSLKTYKNVIIPPCNNMYSQSPNVSSDIAEKSSDQAFSIFPNPSAGNLSISAVRNNLIREIKIIDKLGNILKIFSFNDSKTVDLNLRDLELGTYVIIVSDGYKMESKQIVLNQ